ncbi:MAG: translocation/assembly module TamB domain-containing protein [Oligoflexia bacterium]|nr:translocation/assembly module TamB domain-containing protein [Oligoflexia bacterium]MBF0367418.1 translocation/assembly module TamB domain-containing protein [Oligoflexia bacterium]
MIKRIIKRIGISLVGITFLLAFVTVMIFYFPQIIGVKPVSTQLAKALIPKGYQAHFDDFKLELSTPSFFKKRMVLKLQNFCFFQEKGVFELCFNKVYLPLEIKFYSMQIDALTVGDAELLEGKLIYKLAQKQESAQEQEEGPESLVKTIQQFKSLLDKSIVKSLKITFNKIELLELEKGKSYGGQLSLDMKMPKDRLELLLTGEQLYGPPLEGKKNKLELKIYSASLGESKRFPVVVNIKSNIVLAQGQKVDLLLQSSPLKASIVPLELKVKVSMVSKEQTLQSEGSVSIEQSKLKGVIKVEASKRAWINPRQKYQLSLRECTFSYRYDQLQFIISSNGEIRFDCKMLAKIPTFTEEKIALPTIETQVSLQMSVRDHDDSNKFLNGQLQFRIIPFANRLMKGNGSGQFKFKGTLSELRQGQEIQGKMNLAMKIQEFQMLQTILREQKLLIPAPLHVLRGPLELELQGNIPYQNLLGDISFMVRSDLFSERQALKAMFLGHMLLRKQGDDFSPEINGSLYLGDIRLVLPDVLPNKSLRLFPDQRIFYSQQAATKAAKADPSRLKTDLHISTVHQNAIKLTTTYSKQSIPISIKMHLKDNQVQAGEIQVQPFALNLFRKNAQLSFFKVTMRPEVSQSPVSGEVLIRYTDYLIMIKFVGTIDRPQILLESNPPLEQNQIMAVLLFSKPIEELTEEEGTSVMSVKAAAANGAITLASLYILSSTPIESVGYNPETGQISAKIKLGSKTSLSLGAEPGSLETIGIRRELGSNFILSSEVRKEPEEAKSNIWTFLEWHKRY